jgi:hypothetical protein
VSPAATDKRFELGALLFGEANDILFVNGENPRFGLLPMRVSARFLLLNASVTED